MSAKILGIDVGSVQICAVIAQHNSNGTKILGTGIAKSQGLKKGSITNIDLAAKSIKSALQDAQSAAGTHYDKVVVSISGAYTKNVDSKGVVNIPNHEIGIKEIERAVERANNDAVLPNGHEKLHILPYGFKIDGQDNIEDPLGMNGSRLEVQVHIITVQSTSLNNLKKALEIAGVTADNIVLNAYASAIATLNQDEKELGVALIDMGGDTCNLVIHSGNSIRYTDFLPVGSAHITQDLSTAMHTPQEAAEKIKIDYGSLYSNTNELVALPVMGDEGKNKEVSLEIISNVIHARVEETLMILAKMFEDSGYKDYVGAGIVLTGGMTKLEGIRELATLVFDNIPIRIARPKELDGLYETLKDPAYSAAIGLVIYGSGGFTPYEIDSNNKMRYKDEIIEPRSMAQGEANEFLLDLNIDEKQTEKEKLANIADLTKEEKRENSLAKLWHRLTQLF